MGEPAVIAKNLRESPLSDETLIQQIADGNKLAMRALFARHQVRVYRFALRIVRDTALADDVVSEVFIDAWQHAGRYEGRSTGVDLAARHHPPQGADRRQSPADRVDRLRDRHERGRPREFAPRPRSARRIPGP